MLQPEARARPGMLSKSIVRARPVTALCAFALLLSSCSSLRPWRNEPAASEVNIAFVVDHNLLYLPSVTIDNRAGRYFFSTASPRSVLDPAFVTELRGPKPSYVLGLGQKEALQFNPVSLKLGTVGDAMVGADVWGNRSISIDYVSGLLTYQKEGIHAGLMTLYHFDAQPMVSIDVDGRKVDAVVDTASPDTLQVPGAVAGRHTAHVTIAGSDLGSIDIAVAPGLTQARLGNRLLSKFLVSIDYGQRLVGLWRDPRVR
jgi:hypothetical protein